MALIKRKDLIKTKNVVNVKDLYVAITTITLSYDDGTLNCPRNVTWFYLVRCEDDEYYEFFAGKNIEKEEDLSNGKVTHLSLDTPYIKSVAPLSDYLVDESNQKIDTQSLYQFINNMNVLNSIGAFDEDEEEDKGEEDDNDY